MRNHTVEIGDRDGNTFKIFLATPNAVGSMVNNVGNWRAIDKGNIKFNSGSAARYRNDKDSTLSDLTLNFKTKEGWGIWLQNYEDFWGVNDYGTGLIAQPWCVKMRPGDISWTLLD